MRYMSIGSEVDQCSLSKGTYFLCAAEAIAESIGTINNILHEKLAMKKTISPMDAKITHGAKQVGASFNFEAVFEAV